jgi:hypothetical protein
MNRFFDFMFLDTRLRWTVYGVSAGITSVYAFISLWVLHHDEERVFSQLIWVLFSSVLLMMAAIFIWESVMLARRSLPAIKPVGVRFILVGFFSWLFMVTMLNLDIRSFQGYIADSALKHISLKFDSAQAAVLSPAQVQSSVQKVQSIINNQHIAVSSQTLNKTQTALSSYLKHSSLPEHTKQAAYATTLDLESATYKAQVQSGEIKPRQISETGFPIASNVIFNHDVYLVGGHSELILNGGSFIVSNGTAVFDKIDFRNQASPYALVSAANGNIVVIDSIYQGGLERLDGITWINVEFRNTRIENHGGPIRLRNVTFTDCDLRLLMFQGPRDLWNFIEHNPGKPINYVYEPAQGNPSNR